MSGFRLDAGARTVLDVALGTAGANGDRRCGTEHLLFGIVATATAEMAEMTAVFALDTLRVERAINNHRSHACAPGKAATDPPLSRRAHRALGQESLSGAAEISEFDLLLGCLDDSQSGAATVLRQLGVRVGEIRRLAELGAARLDEDEVAGLIAALDRRADGHQSWWGPAPDAGVRRIPLPEGRSVEVTRSRTAVVNFDGLVAAPDGFGFTLSISSGDDWVLPPRWEPREDLILGVGARYQIMPDVVVIDLRYPDGTVVSNRNPQPRWSPFSPPDGLLVRLGERSTAERRNDRRIAERRVETVDFWSWPLPSDGDIRLDLSWPAEAICGSLRIDASTLRAEALNLRAAS